MYYIIAQAAEDASPKLLICGDLEFIDQLGSTEWAEKLVLPDSLGLATRQDIGDPGKFVTIAGLNLKSD
jgi:hypothetical protein